GTKMPKSIVVSDEIYSQLEKLAVGFDTPERVIARLIHGVGSTVKGMSAQRPELSFVPDEVTFKSNLLVHKRAQVILHMANGERDVIQWNAARLKASSNLRANLWSGILRNWKDKGIVFAELSVLSVDGDDSREAQKLIAIAGELGWTTEEVEEYLVDVQLILSDDDHPYYHLATFS